MILLLFCGVLGSDVNAIGAYFNRCELAREDRIEATADEIKAQLKTLRTLPRRQRRAFAKSIAANKERLKDLKNERLPYWAELPRNAEGDQMGDVGMVSVFQVVDRSNVLVRRYSRGVTVVAGGRVRNTQSYQLLWVSGVDTSKMRDGVFQRIGLVKYAGSKTYVSVGGASKTVLVVSPIDEKMLTERFRLKSKKETNHGLNLPAVQ